jgi:hypothetical protein
MEKNTLSSWLGWFALLPAGLFTGLWLLLGMGEVKGGDLSGIIHLVPALLIIVLVIAAWKRPRIGGVAMLLAGAVIFIYLFASIQSPDSRLPGALLTGGPFLLSGVLFLLAGMSKNLLPARR